MQSCERGGKSNEEEDNKKRETGEIEWSKEDKEKKKKKKVAKIKEIKLK